MSNDVTRFVDAKKLDQPCKLCRNPNWEVIYSEPGPYDHQINSRQFFSMTCTNCGLTNLHDVSVVAKWARKK
jgi:predicted nucleic-acid-binding Zn-ribbon protein